MLFPPSRRTYFQSHRERKQQTKKKLFYRKMQNLTQKNCLFLISSFFNNKQKWLSFLNKNNIRFYILFIFTWKWDRVVLRVIYVDYGSFLLLLFVFLFRSFYIISLWLIVIILLLCCATAIHLFFLHLLPIILAFLLRCLCFISS